MLRLGGMVLILLDVDDMNVIRCEGGLDKNKFAYGEGVEATNTLPDVTLKTRTMNNFKGYAH